MKFTLTRRIRKIYRFILLTIPLVIFIAYRPGEMILLLNSSQKFTSVWGHNPDIQSAFEARVFGDNVLFSILSFGLVSCGFGAFYGSAKKLSLRMVFFCSTTTVILLSIPVMIYRIRQVLDQWGFEQVLPFINLWGNNYVRVQNICSTLCGCTLLVATLCSYHQSNVIKE